MKNRDFDDFIEGLEKTNMDVKNFVNFNKVFENVEEIEVHLNALNYLICNNKEELLKRVDTLYQCNEECFKVLPILVAIRSNNTNFCIFMQKERKFNELIQSKEDVINFLNETKLIDLILRGKVKNFVDYTFGIEVGLDSNARKNRNGKQEEVIYERIKSIFDKYDFISVEKQIEIDLDSLVHNKKSELKKFDIVIFNQQTNQAFLLEISFYNSSGSKVNETAKSFKHINDLITNVEDKHTKVTFLWIVDGMGIKSIQKNLKNFYQDGYIYNQKQLFEEIENLVLKPK